MGNVETPSGKGSGDENFPVGSFLLPANLRPHVATYYAFARAADDIADNPNLQPEDKVRRLDAFDAALTGQADEAETSLAKVHAVRRSMAASGVDIRHARDLLIAFKQDAVKGRYRNWDELIDYCNHSAAPVGRFLLELHGEDKAGFAWSDPLCNALQVINHLQDCAKDFAELDRVYLPEDWLSEAMEDVDCLSKPRSTSGLRQVLDRCLEQTRILMDEARKLPAQLSSRRLAMESAIIVRIADRLIDKLSQEDPVAQRVELNKLEFAGCGLGGVLAGLFRR